MRLALIFPGQGTQYPGMGSDLERDFPEAAAVRNRIELGLRAVDPELNLRRTMNSLSQADRIATDVCQLVVFTHSVMAWAALRSQISSANISLEIVAALGHSFGELTAHLAADSMDVEEMAGLVLRRGRTMARAPAGGLLNVEGLDADDLGRRVGDFLRRSPRRKVFIAINQALRLHAVGGDREDLEAFAVDLGRSGVHCRMVRGVQHPLHTPLQIDARREFEMALGQVTLRPSSFPVLSTVRGDFSEPARVGAELAGQIDGAMRFSQAVERLVTCAPDRYLVIGPGSKIAELLAYYNHLDPKRVRVVERSKQVSRVAEELGVGRPTTRVSALRGTGHSYLRRALRDYERGKERYVLIEPDGESRDLGEELDRSGTFILFKGSFNPLHLGHVELFRTSQRRHPDAWGAFALSAHTNKGFLDRRQLLSRARLILKAGFPVVLSRSGYFFENVQWLRSRAPGLRLVLLVGVDALRRLIEYFSPAEFGQQFSGVVFEYAGRRGHDELPHLQGGEAYSGLRKLDLEAGASGISSSHIRALAANGDEGQVKSLMPPGAAEEYLNRFHRTPRGRATGGIPRLVTMRQRLGQDTAQESRLRPDRGDAAVALILAGSDGDVHLCLIRRADSSNDPWAGHLALPGGRAQSGDRDPFAVAAREAREELGLRLGEARWVAPLQAMTIRLAGGEKPLTVSGCVYYLGAQLAPLIAGSEVAHAFWVPMSHLWDSRNATSLRLPEEDASLRYPAITLGSEVVWGITLRVLMQFSDVVGCPLPHFEEIPGMREAAPTEGSGGSS